ncbi:serine/threonine-protein kinase RIO2 [Methanolobus halotolerans]|uniref:non-specific serine/threonine protein kinase n=1 Tax=Methanolobus halotolerans TaxID=2052935 RepID=A0A4E0R269_9EURY|nr:RIO1 family regulatory kinase/ATPase [Methanolobus halotolerans]TGC11473.1 serine/threonine protein kinase [Methanolobus halotolerans]
MIADVIKIFRELDSKDLRIIQSIEIGMKHYEWVPVEELLKITRLSYSTLVYRIRALKKKNLVVVTNIPYEGYQIYYDAYDALALNTFVKRGTISAIGDEVGVGKESVVLEAVKEPELGIGEPQGVVIKFHREGRTSFKAVKRVRSHLEDKEHFSWIYAARLSAKREAEAMNKMYPDVSVPRLIDNNRHALVMEIAKGNLLYRTKLEDPAWFLDCIIDQMKKIYQKGVIHSDLSEYNIFVHEGGIQIIDWPQYVDTGHPHADELLERDVGNLLKHFKRKYNLIREPEDVLAVIKASEEA